jgi:hypothetical protein
MREFKESVEASDRSRNGVAGNALTLLVSLPLLLVICGLLMIGAGSVVRPTPTDQSSGQVAFRLDAPTR